MIIIFSLFVTDKQNIERESTLNTKCTFDAQFSFLSMWHSYLKTLEIKDIPTFFFSIQATPDGRKAKSTITLEGEKLIHLERDPGTHEVVSTITREVVGDKLINTFVATKGNVTAVRRYTRKQ